MILRDGHLYLLNNNRLVIMAMAKIKAKATFFET